MGSAGLADRIQHDHIGSEATAYGTPVDPGNIDIPHCICVGRDLSFHGMEGHFYTRSTDDPHRHANGISSIRDQTYTAASVVQVPWPSSSHS